MSFNLLIDPLPREYKGYLIRWQFWNGILISNCLGDSERFEDTDQGRIEKLYTSFNLLFGNGVPPFDVALDGIKWFLSCGGTKQNDNENSEQYFSFDDDHERLFSSFMVKFGINLNKTTDLHFFEFISLMNDLHKTSFRNVVDLRMLKTKDLKNYSKEQKAEILKQKRKFAIKQVLEKKYTDSQKQAIDYFDNLVGMNKEKQCQKKTDKLE